MTLVIRPAHDEELGAVGALTLDAYAADGFVAAVGDYAEELRDAATRAREAELYVAVAEDGMLLGTVTYCPAGSPYQDADPLAAAAPAPGSAFGLAASRTAGAR